MHRPKILLAFVRSLVAVSTAAVATTAFASPSLTILDPDLEPMSTAWRLSPDGTLITGVRWAPGFYRADGVRWTRDSGWSESPGAGHTDYFEGTEIVADYGLSATNELLYYQFNYDGLTLRIAPDGAEPSIALPMPDGCTPSQDIPTGARSRPTATPSRLTRSVAPSAGPRAAERR